MAYNKQLTSVFFLTMVLFTFHISHIESKLPRKAMTEKSSAVVAQFLKSHNNIRAKHNLPLLKWSIKLANHAKWYANQRRADCALVHSNSDFGENIFWGSGARWNASDAVMAWADEEPDYSYRENKCMHNKQCLHYTQLVWKSTEQVGCARIKCNSGDTFVVCEYFPYGNVIGQRPY